MHQLQLVSPSPSCSIVFSVLLLGLSNYLTFHFLSVLPTDQLKPQSSSFDRFSFLLSLIITWCGRLAEIKWSVCISKSQERLCVSYSRTESVLCIYHLFVWSNLNFLHDFTSITLTTQSCLVLDLFVQICCNRLLCDWSFRLCYDITYFCYFQRLVYFCFDIVGSYGIVLCCYQKKFCFSPKVSFS